MKPTIFVARHIPDEAEAYLKEHCLVDKWVGGGPIPRERLLERLGEAEGLLTSSVEINAELLAHAPRLRAVSTISVGYNNFDLAAMRARGIIGMNTPEVLDETVADLIMGLILSTARRIPELDRYVKEGRWRRGDDELGRRNLP